MKSVEFDVPGAAEHQRREMVKYVCDIAREIYNVELDLAGVDLQQYYRPDGAKITKSLASLLRKEISKEEVQSKFGPFAKRVSELYTIGLTLRAEWADKTLIGEGVYESGKTCFRKDGENAVSKDFIVANRRCDAVVLYQKGKKDAGGRCLVYFAGNRNIYLTNFYWRAIPQNKLYFITAIRHLLGLKKVLYRQNPKFFLPIFKNGDSVLVYDERTRPVMPTKMLSCPHCGVMVPEGELYSEEGGSHRLVGCTRECARKHSRMYTRCEGCGKHVNVASVSAVGNHQYCQPCYKKMMLTCFCCGSGMLEGTQVDIEGLTLCRQCSRRKCATCGKILPDQSLAKKIGDIWVCYGCLPHSGHMCVVCRTTSQKKIPMTKIGKVKIAICTDCSTPLPGTYLETQGGKRAASA